MGGTEVSQKQGQPSPHHLQLSCRTHLVAGGGGGGGAAWHRCPGLRHADAPLPLVVAPVKGVSSSHPWSLSLESTGCCCVWTPVKPRGEGAGGRRSKGGDAGGGGGRGLP